MTSRVERVVLSYLHNKKISQTEMNEEVLNEANILDKISQTLDDLYPPYINSKLRKLDISELLVASTRIVRHFGPSSESIFQKEISNLKNKILNAVGESATSKNSSLVQKYYDYFKTNPTSNPEDIEDYIRKDLIRDSRDTQKETLKYVNKSL